MNAKPCQCCLAARRSAINASTEAQLQVFSLVIAAPEPIRVRFRGQKLAMMLTTAASLRVHACWDIETTSTVVALRTLARRAHAMLKEARELQKAIVAIIRSWRPDLLEEFGVGPIVAATVLCAWSHPGRVHSEAAFAMLAGVAPIPANSGQVTTRYRLNRYGDRQLNRALHTVVRSRIQYQPATRDYLARRSAEGKTSREIKRCLARYVARDLYRRADGRGLSAKRCFWPDTPTVSAGRLVTDDRDNHERELDTEGTQEGAVLAGQRERARRGCRAGPGRSGPGEDITGPDGLLKSITATVLEAALEEEMTDHLGHAKHQPAADGGGNIRNGTRAKTVLTDAAGSGSDRGPPGPGRHVRTGHRQEAAAAPDRRRRGRDLAVREGADHR